MVHSVREHHVLEDWYLCHWEKVTSSPAPNKVEKDRVSFYSSETIWLWYSWLGNSTCIWLKVNYAIPIAFGFCIVFTVVLALATESLILYTASRFMWVILNLISSLRHNTLLTRDSMGHSGFDYCFIVFHLCNISLCRLYINSIWVTLDLLYNFFFATCHCQLQETTGHVWYNDAGQGVLEIPPVCPELGHIILSVDHMFSSKIHNSTASVL